MSKQLSQHGRDTINAFEANVARAFGVDDANQQFAVEPSLAQTLNELIVEQAGGFLGRINVLPVDELKGEKILMGLSGRVSGRTDTSANDRVPKNLVSLSDKGYELFKTESDIALTYSQIDTWAKFKNFAEMYMKAVRQAIANDRVYVGWMGTSVANPSVENDLSDLNKGWLQLLRDYNGGSQVSGGAITLGEGGTHNNLDLIVHDLIGLIDPVFRGQPGLKAYIGRDLIQAAQGDYYETQGSTPSEKEKIKRVYQTYGGLPAETPPFFPDGKILVTTDENLSIYWQSDSWRRKLEDNAKRDQYEDFNSRNEGYVVEEERAAAFADDVSVYVAP